MADSQAQETPGRWALKNCNKTGKAKIACYFIGYVAVKGEQAAQKGIEKKVELTVEDWHRDLKKEKKAKTPELDDPETAKAVKTEIARLTKKN